ncbi:K02A2.6-like [Cordylochernes scorpioides]|uniref:RNA-directed DNA polymerase n=1 Tax=Cordylochernes scorpioides TaxID=51811 RepID=A0ABY6K986_9ARAC|nr:K02A2.6-like [Cordylochernes scorpioides]
MSAILRGINGVICLIDDILIFAKRKEEYDETLREVLRRLKNSGITLNKEKCQFGVSNVTFLGHYIDELSIKADEKKVKTKAEMKPPAYLHGVQGFMGMINFIGRFVPNLAEITKPLNDLRKKDASFIWGSPQKKAFEKVKDLLASDRVLASFDISKKTMVSADASSYGLGAVLKLEHEDNEWRPVAFASRTLTKMEQRYAQIQKEALAITWACERFKDYVVGKTFLIETDHKPLVPIFTTKDLNDLTPRLQYIVLHQSTTDERLAKIALNQKLEPTLQNVVFYSKNGWPAKCQLSPLERSFYDVRDEIGEENGLLMKGLRVIIPSNMRKDVLNRIYAGHLGMTKCRTIAKDHVWWKGIGQEIQDMVKTCEKCIENQPLKNEPFIPSEFPERANKDPVLALMEYRATPLAKGLSPAELLFERKIRTMVPCTSSSLTPKTVDQYKLRGEEEQRKMAQKRLLTDAMRPRKSGTNCRRESLGGTLLFWLLPNNRSTPCETSPDSQLPAETEETPGNELPAEELQQQTAIAPEMKQLSPSSMKVSRYNHEQHELNVLGQGHQQIWRPQEPVVTSTMQSLQARVVQSHVVKIKNIGRDSPRAQQFPHSRTGGPGLAGLGLLSEGPSTSTGEARLLPLLSHLELIAVLDHIFEGPQRKSFKRNLPSRGDEQGNCHRTVKRSWVDQTDCAQDNDNDVNGFITVRRREVNPPFLRKTPSNPSLGAPGSLGSGPRYITKMVFLEFLQEFSPVDYIDALEYMLGKDCVHQLAKMSDGIEIRGALLKAFPYRKKPDKITLNGLRFFIEDSDVIKALRPFCQVTSIAPVILTDGKRKWQDTRRFAFVLMHDGMKVTQLPARINILTEGITTPVYITHGIKCNKCQKIGYIRVNCPQNIRAPISSVPLTQYKNLGSQLAAPSNHPTAPPANTSFTPAPPTTEVSAICDPVAIVSDPTPATSTEHETSSEKEEIVENKTTLTDE